MSPNPPPPPKPRFLGAGLAEREGIRALAIPQAGPEAPVPTSRLGTEDQTPGHSRGLLSGTSLLCLAPACHQRGDRVSGRRSDLSTVTQTPGIKFPALGAPGSAPAGRLLSTESAWPVRLPPASVWHASSSEQCIPTAGKRGPYPSPRQPPSHTHTHPCTHAAAGALGKRSP